MSNTVTTDLRFPAPAHAVTDSDPPAPRRRVRGLRLAALPSAPLVMQLTGGVGTLIGVWLEWGTAIALIVGGVTAAVLGALREAGKI